MTSLMMCKRPSEVDPAWDFDRNDKGRPCFHQPNIWLALAKMGVQLYSCVPRDPRQLNNKARYIIEGFGNYGPILGSLAIDELQQALTTEFRFEKAPSKGYFREQVELVARETSLETTGRILVEDMQGRLTIRGIEGEQ